MKILFICSNLIGDTILSTGAIRHFIEENQHSKLTFVVGPTAAPLLVNYNNIEEIIIFKKKKFNFHWLDIFKKTFGKKWDIIIDFRSSIISYVLVNKKKYIFKKNNTKHHIEQLKENFGFNCSNLNIPTSHQEKENANKYIDNSKIHIVIFPGGNWTPKLWSSKNYNFLMRSILNNFRKTKFILVGSLNEKKKFINDLKINIKDENIIDLFGASLTMTSAYMSKSNLFIGNDSGLMHLAVASKLRVVALFGPTDDSIYGPYGGNNSIIRTPETIRHFKSINLDHNISYMNSIKPEIVLKKCTTILNEIIN